MSFNLITHDSIASQKDEGLIHSRDQWSSQPPSTDSMGLSFPSTMNNKSYDITQDDLNHKFCRNTRSTKYRDSFEEEINDSRYDNYYLNK